MIFAYTWQQVLDGTKTQTRRLADGGDELRVNNHPNGEPAFVWYVDNGWCGHEGPSPACYPGRIKWQVGRTYAVQPGRGKPAVGRIRITAIRQERLQDITPQDAAAEGIEKETCFSCKGTGRLTDYVESEDITEITTWACDDCDGTGWYSPVEAYAYLWDSIYTKPGTRWADNPLVWVLEFESE